jgi:hypothetical protein
VPGFIPKIGEHIVSEPPIELRLRQKTVLERRFAKPQSRAHQ